MKAARIFALLALLAPLSVAGQQPADPGEQIELSSEVVLVNVVATRGHGFASGLSRDDFAIAEDGASQHIEFFGAEEIPFAAAICLDTSGSMEFKLTLARAAAARFMDRTRPNDRIAVYTFADQVTRLQDFTPGRRDLADGIWDARPDGVTKMYDCVADAARSLATREERRRAILLISDGADYGSRASKPDVVKRAQAAGITIYTIDLAPMGGKHAVSSTAELLGKGALRELASQTGGTYFGTKGGDDLNQAFSTIVDELGHQYTLGYYSTNTRRDGTYRKIAVTTRAAGVALRAREGYTAPKD